MKIIEEIREITSKKVAEKQLEAKDHYPKIISQIKHMASMGKNSCEFKESDIDSYTRELLLNDGFRVIIYTKTRDGSFYNRCPQPTNIWEVSW